MSTDFEKLLADKLLTFKEVDWEENRVTLRIMSDGNYSDTEEAEIWGKALGNIASTIVNKLTYKYGDCTDAKMVSLYEKIQMGFMNEIDIEISDLTSNES